MAPFKRLFCIAGDNRLTAKTADRVIVDHAGRLHVRVADRRADELETTLL